MSEPKIFLVGESNPVSASPRHALYPFPVHHSGGRLCFDILKMDYREYLRAFERRNVLQLAEGERWSAPKAREAARLIGEEAHAAWGPGGTPRMVVLGQKVCAAFGVPYQPLQAYQSRACIDFFVLPHPSGLNRMWNEPFAYDRAREAFAAWRASE